MDFKKFKLFGFGFIKRHYQESREIIAALTLVPRDARSSALPGYHAHTQCVYIHAGNTHKHKNQSEKQI